MKITIIAVGKAKNEYLKTAINDYLKQCKSVNIIEISDEKSIDLIDKEADNILNKINDKDYVITLEIEGKELSSIDLKDKIVYIQEKLNKNIVFIIGGSFGLSSKVRQRSDFAMSLSKMTFPHMVARLLLVEQIYRSFMIMKNHPYHK